MHRRASLILLFGASAAAAVAAGNAQPGLGQYQPPAPPGFNQYQPAPPSSPMAASVAQWNSLRQSDALPFSSYASFLARHRGWPGEAAMRRSAERRLALEPTSPSEVARFFSLYPPLTPGGHAQHAFALQAGGRGDEARAAARRAWTGGVLPQADEQRLLAAFGSGFSAQDHEVRMEVLLGGGDSQSAARTLMWAPAQKRTLYETRLALQTRAADAASRLGTLDPAARRDAGLIVDQAVWLRNTGQSAAARQALAGSAFDRPPAGVARWLDTALTLARGAANDSQWSTVYAIASKLNAIYPPGTEISERPYGERDDYTSLAWLGGTAALHRLGRPADAARMFELYARAARSPQTRAKGFYWAARAGNAAGQTAQAASWLDLAAASPDQFYGQLALERLGRPLMPPAPAFDLGPAERAAFARRPLAEAIRYLGLTGRRGDQTLFVRALAESLANDQERALAGDFGRQVGRLDLGVWAAREARNMGATFYARAAFPDVAIPSVYSRYWAFAHGIMRQESSFERTAVSSAGARGLMQLMPGTARQAASRTGQSYALGRLTDDAQYNILLGNHHLTELMDEWGGNALLVAAAYNAGSGNVRRWVAQNGDPRLPGADVLRWIEDIPFAETRNYVQRVIENAVVYEMINPNRGGQQRPISSYLGQRAP
jgi:soluble lytic murein transglycosylase